MSIPIKGYADDAPAGIGTSFVSEAQKDDALEVTARIAENEETSKQDDLDEANPLVAAFRNFDKKIQAHTASKLKAKEAKTAQKKLIPLDEIKDGAQKFKNSNPQFLFDTNKLLEFAKKLPNNATHEEILKVIHEEFPDPIQANLAWKFVESIGLYNKETIEAFNEILNEEVVESLDKREEEVAKKVEAEAVAINQEATALSLQIVQGGDLNKLLDHLMINPLEAPVIFKMLDDAYGKDLKKIEYYLLKKCGLEVNKLVVLEDSEDIAHMKNATALIKKLQAIIWVDRFFENRNKPEQAKGSAAGMK